MRRTLRLESSEREEADRVPRRAVDRQVGEDLADRAAELEAVAGEARADDDVRRVRVAVDHEVLVRAELEEAGLERHRRAVPVREVALDARAQDPLVLRVRP